jgi:hypothetical protein
MTSRQANEFGLLLDRLTTMYGPVMAVGTPADRAQVRDEVLEWADRELAAARRALRKSSARRRTA